MQNQTFVGRKEQIQILRDLNKKNSAQLAVVYGPDGMGKTTLIEQAYQNERVWRFEGLYSLSEEKQIEYFMYNLAEYAGKPELKEKKGINWKKALTLLEDQILNQKVIIVFDNLEWLSNKRASFIATLKRVWDKFYKSHKRVRLILCGSDSTFIVDKVLQSKAFQGKIDAEIELPELSFPEREVLLTQISQSNKKSKKKIRENILDISLACGGVPALWQKLNPSGGVDDHLNKQTFHHSGDLFKHFRQFFLHQLDSNLTYESVLLSLSLGSKSSQDIADALGVRSGGSLFRWLDELEAAGFIERYCPIDKGPESKTFRYRITDTFTQFYGSLISPNSAEIVEGEFSLKKVAKTDAYSSWQNQALSKICRDNASKIAKTLGFANTEYSAGSWFRRDTDSSEQTSPETDLLFERKSGKLTICEIQYALPKAINKLIEQFERKVAIIHEGYEGFRIQRVLILAHKQTIPPNIKSHFDRTLFASEIL